MAVALLAFALVFGGASRIEVPGWIVVNAAAIGTMFLLVWSAPQSVLRIDRGAAWLIAALIAIPLIQLIPLPFSVWSSLPGRALEVEAFRIIGSEGWLPISMLPGRTLMALLSLLAPIGAFFVASQLDERGRHYLVIAIVVLVCASALLGVMQIGGGEDSPLRIFKVTANDAAVGLFANPNHQATLLMCAVPLAVVVFVDRLPRRGGPPVAMMVTVVAVICFLAAGMLLTWSRAGLVFLGLMLLGSVFLLPDLMPHGRRRLLAQRGAMVGAGAVLCGLIAAIMFLFGTGGAMEAAREQGGARIDNLPRFLVIARDHLPFGTGLGSFDPVYRTYETLETLYPRYLNQAHNEPAQIFIEAGVPGVLLLLAFLMWWGRAGLSAWRAKGESTTLRRGAMLASMLFLIHSLVDYPLRTPSAAVVFAMLCALMLPAPDRGGARAPGSL